VAADERASSWHLTQAMPRARGWRSPAAGIVAFPLRPIRGLTCDGASCEVLGDRLGVGRHGCRGEESPVQAQRVLDLSRIRAPDDPECRTSLRFRIYELGVSELPDWQARTAYQPRGHSFNRNPTLELRFASSHWLGLRNF